MYAETCRPYMYEQRLYGIKGKVRGWKWDVEACNGIFDVTGGCSYI